jgi:hypothetical protein
MMSFLYLVQINAAHVQNSSQKTDRSARSSNLPPYKQRLESVSPPPLQCIGFQDNLDPHARSRPTMMELARACLTLLILTRHAEMTAP